MVAVLRARHRLRTPDAIVLATGVHAGASAAITNDESWPSLPALKVLTLSKLID